jgi:hypothetical protein
MIETYQEALIMAAAGAAGVAQTYVLVKFVEPSTPMLIPQLGGFGRTSSIVPILAGAAAMAVGMYSMKTGKILRDPRIQYALMAYGGASLAGGLVTGMQGAGMMSRAFPRTAAVRAVPVGAGYSQVNKREQNIL